MLKSICTVITNDLLKTLPDALSEQFELENDEVKEFLTKFLKENINTPTKRSAGGKRGTTGFMVFSAENRAQVKEELTENGDLEDVKNANPVIAKEMGRRWQDLDDQEKEDYKVKAKEQNHAKGIFTQAELKARKEDPSVEKKNNQYVIEGTNFVVAGKDDPTVTGTLKGKKVTKLTAANKKKCDSEGWTY